MNSIIKVLLSISFLAFVAGCDQKNTSAPATAISAQNQPAAEASAPAQPVQAAIPANLEEVKTAAANGSLPAQDILASHEKALKGDSEGMFYMGIFYYDGVHIKQDIAEAQKWFKQAADKGNTRSYYYLGRICQYGQLGSVDIKQAKVWYKKSADAGVAQGADALKALNAAK